MKLLILPLLAATLGAGWYGVASRSDDAPAQPSNPGSECSPNECRRVTVECTPRGTCLVTCYDEDGNVCCQQEVACDRPCESSACEGAKSCSPRQ